jgi:hypothetical protein
MHQRFEKLMQRKKDRIEKLEREVYLKKVEKDRDEYFPSHKPEINANSKELAKKRPDKFNFIE